MNGIDVSKWQGDINWLAVKASGIEFVIIKAGGSDAGFYEDPKFQVNYSGAYAAGIPIGVYYFVGPKCVTYDDGVADAKRLLKILDGRALSFPAFIDVETTPTAEKAGATWAVLGFCETVKAAGYMAGVYGSDISSFKDRLDVYKLNGIDKWVAKYNTAPPSYVTDYAIWQKSDRGSVPGISGNVDLNETAEGYNPMKDLQPVPEKNHNTELINKLLDIQSQIKEIIEKL